MRVSHNQRTGKLFAIRYLISHYWRNFANGLLHKLPIRLFASSVLFTNEAMFGKGRMTNLHSQQYGCIGIPINTIQARH